MPIREAAKTCDRRMSSIEPLKDAAMPFRFFHHLRQKYTDVVPCFAARFGVDLRPCVRKKKTLKTSTTSSATTRTRETRCVDVRETVSGKTALQHAVTSADNLHQVFRSRKKIDLQSNAMI